MRAQALGCGITHYRTCRRHDGCLLAQAADFVESILRERGHPPDPAETLERVAEAIWDRARINGRWWDELDAPTRVHYRAIAMAALEAAALFPPMAR
jgi:hypothetical protein